MTRFVNNLKTTFLLTLLFVLILTIGGRLGGQGGLMIAFIFGLAMNVGAYFYSDKIALATMRGQEVDAQSAPDLYHMVGRLAGNAGLPMPKVYICPQEAPNAFATGRSPKHAAVAVTHGALKLLSYDELEGVMAHELAHVKNRDTLTSCIVATLAGVITMVASMAKWGMIFGGLGGQNRDHNIFADLLMIILAPFAAVMIQMAVSRSREFVADHDGARIAGTPYGLISALQKLESQSSRMPLQGASTTQNHMFIVSPAIGKNLAGLFRTHPRTEERVAKLRDMVA
ncbi:MAG TPA: protease HtpX [Phycisphaerales bacterium]|nr:protease HtpX [Phycisphaerales bacterium]HCD31687.1 protease HtpX [Phycisphaerales bacterium]|tara:strand:+ start:326 stop:1180 length:855 start_codon:yes stop_codon:yes gene_type:complete